MNGGRILKYGARENERQRVRYQADSEYRKRKNERTHTRYHGDTGYRERQLKQRQQLEYRKRKNDKRRKRYTDDTEYRGRITARIHARRIDPIKRERILGQERAIVARRRARKKELPIDFTREDAILLTLYWNRQCAVCGRYIENDNEHLKLAIDHWIALDDKRVNNPGTVITNLLPLCHGKGGCNNSKGNKDPEQWLHEAYSCDEAEAILGRIKAYFLFIIWAREVRSGVYA